MHRPICERCGWPREPIYSDHVGQSLEKPRERVGYKPCVNGCDGRPRWGMGRERREDT
jgi:hypothetical protein